MLGTRYMSHMTLGTCCSTLGNRRRCHVGHDDQRWARRWARRWALESLRSGRWAPDEDVTLGTTTNVGHDGGHDVGHSIVYVRDVGHQTNMSHRARRPTLGTTLGTRYFTFGTLGAVQLSKVLSKTKSISLSTHRGSLKLSRVRVYTEFHGEFESYGPGA